MNQNSNRGTRTSLVVIFILAVMIAVLAFFLGRKSGSTTIENIATNATIIRQISELSTLEVQGNASIKSSNVANDGSITDNLKKLFMENTVNITVPYVAKYGVDLDKQEIKIEEQNKKVVISLPQPKLLSYEMRMDKVSSITNQGWLQAENNAYFSKVEQKLYTQSRSQMENNVTNINRSKTKIAAILAEYYRPTGYEAEVYFAGEKLQLKTDQ
ncbi:DUF4230 domain-containing protein [Haoranjiania flava]|uniref:DUF4230 domain-containing protein n=1 Tax=Haoranjiania flava TaxID=1856322 RepID=A0AAE3LL65_9BACT|nr:DUF4230 domain-containing protein [Haoranjiania flava]MCU7695308.1 DUF4230 domain-containing protein [Haoranjiania flava]